MKANHIFVTMTMVAAMLFAGCDGTEKEVDGQIVVPNSSELTQNAYADDDETDKGVNFTAKSSWTATANEATKSGINNVPWLKLFVNGQEKYSGDAGTYKLVIKLDPNYTGEKRTAKIVIEAGGDDITITVTQEDKTAGGEVPQDPNPVDRIDLSDYSIELMVGESEVVEASVWPETATVKSVFWSSSNETVASVDQDGKVTGVSAGEATIKAVSTAYPDVYAECGVTVYGEQEPTGTGSFSIGGKKYDILVADKVFGGDHFRDGHYRMWVEFNGPEWNSNESQFDNEYSLALDCYLDADMYQDLATGEYNYSDVRKPFVFTNGSVQIGAQEYQVTGGKMNLQTIDTGAKDDDGEIVYDYNITFSLKTSGGDVTGSYKGGMENYATASVYYTTRDEVLDQYLIKKYVDPKYNTISWVEAPKITEIDFAYPGSGDKVGSYGGYIVLEMFPNLEKVDLSNHNIKKIVFMDSYYSETMVSQLREINVSENELEGIIDISRLDKLESLKCVNNENLRAILVSQRQLEEYGNMGDKFIIKDGHTQLEVSDRR